MRETLSVSGAVRQSIRVEHYRLHCAERMADSPYKEAVLAAARSTLERLGRALEPAELPVCMVCRSRKVPAVVVAFPLMNGSADHDSGPVPAGIAA